MKLKLIFLFSILTISSSTLPKVNYLLGQSGMTKNRKNFDQSGLIENRKNFDQSGLNENKENFDQSETSLFNDVSKYLGINKNSDISRHDINEITKLFSPRIINPMFLLKQKFTTPPPINNDDERLNETCKRKGGTLVNKECYQFFVGKKTFNDARSFCQGIGGELWTPDFNDADLVKKMVPKVINDNVDGTLIWIGATVQNGKLFDIYGNDISKTYFALLHAMPPTNNNCALLFYLSSSLTSSDVACTMMTSYVCEYPLELEPTEKPTEVNQFHKFGFQLFNKG